MNTDDFDWDRLFERVWNGMSDSTNPYEIHIYAQSKEDVLAGVKPEPDTSDSSSETTEQDKTTATTEKTTEVSATTESQTAKKTPKVTCIKSAKIKAKDLKKRSRKISLKAKTTSDGKLQYKITKYPKRAKKYISVNKKGQVTIKKKAKKGTYVVTITSPETKKYKKISKKVSIRVK